MEMILKYGAIAPHSNENVLMYTRPSDVVRLVIMFERLREDMLQVNTSW